MAAVNKIKAIVADVKADHVASEDSLKDFIGPREQTEDVPWRERNVQEESELERQVFLFCHLANVISAKHEMVIVNPNDRNARSLSGTLLNGLHSSLSEKLIDSHISTPVIS